MLWRQFKEEWYFHYNDNKTKCFPPASLIYVKAIVIFFFSGKPYSDTGFWKLLFWEVKTWHWMNHTGEDLNQ